MWIMKECLCEGNKVLRELEHMRSVAEKAAKMDDSIYILYKHNGVYKFCKEDEEYNGELVEYILP